MTDYINNNDASYQLRPSGYYYQPYVDNGPYATHLEEAGKAVGATVLGVLGADLGKPGAIAGQLIGYYAGGAAGHAAGFYIDNLSAMAHNINTFFDELNDSRSWMAPDLAD